MSVFEIQVVTVLSYFALYVTADTDKDTLQAGVADCVSFEYYSYTN